MAAETKIRILRDAERFVLQGKTSQAINEYLKIVKNDPNDVLTLNTIGDLYLRQGKKVEANGYFTQVAENYARNNFLLKSIAVYKKILNGDPENLVINQTLAALYARHGSNADARNQYLKVAEISTREGKQKESLEAYEKIAQLDPMNSAVQLKLAEFHLTEGSKEKAYGYLAGAARAQVKGGNLSGAVRSFRRAMQLKPLDVPLMRSFFETSMQLKDTTSALEQLKESLATAPDNIDLLEMYGQACLEAGDPKEAARAFQKVVSADEARFGLFFEVHRAFLAAGALDDAATCLDGVVAILISRRGTERAMEAYRAILAADPSHILAWIRLANICYAINDLPHYLEAERKLVDLYLDQQCHQEALEHLECILQVDPTNEQYLQLHHDAYAAAYPGMPYTPPAKRDSATEEFGYGTIQSDPAFERSGAKAPQPDAPTMVEAELLLNYGMYDKALDLLRSLEARDPSNREVRQKLISVYVEQQQMSLAAEQCLVLAALHRKAGEEEEVQKLLAQANTLDAAMVSARVDQLLPPLKPTTVEGSALKAEPGSPGSVAPLEVDLSEDLSEIFFQGSGEAAVSAEDDSGRALPEEMAEEYTPTSTPRMPEGSLSDQLQEVDFYIRLGFHEEARAKLDEISKDHPNDPELPFRYRQISEGLSQQKGVPSPAPPTRVERVQPEPAPEEDLFGSLTPNLAPGAAAKDHGAEPSRTIRIEPELPARPAETPPPEGPREAVPALQESRREAGARGETEEPCNDMFADLMNEVNSLTNQQIARDDFETHFSLGTAYREMRLIDEAISEFQGALKALDASRDAREVIQCCGMLSTCFLEKGMPRSAIRWCESGLGVREISQHESMALRYDMAVAYSLEGEASRALECFEEIFGSDPGYRDIAQKIDELRGGLGHNVP